MENSAILGKVEGKKKKTKKTFSSKNLSLGRTLGDAAYFSEQGQAQTDKLLIFTFNCTLITIILPHSSPAADSHFHTHSHLGSF